MIASPLPSGFINRRHTRCLPVPGLVEMREADRQRQTDRQTERETEADRQTGRGWERDIQTERERERQTNRDKEGEDGR